MAKMDREEISNSVHEMNDVLAAERTKALQNFAHNTAHEFENHKKKTTAAVAIAAVLAAGGAAMDGEVDDNEVSYASMRAPAPIVLEISDPPAEDDSEDDKKNAEEVSAEVSAEAPSGIGETIAKVIVTPIYAVGMGIVYLFKGLMAALATPVLSVLVKWLLTAAVILGALAIAFKTAFPDVPLSKILNRKCISTVLIGVAVISVLCEVVSIMWPAAGSWIELIRLLLGLGIVIPIFMTVMKFFGRKKEAA